MKNSATLRNWQTTIQGLSKTILLGLLLLLSSAVLLDRLYPLPLRKTDQLSTLVLDQRGEVLRGFTSADGYWRLPVELDDVDVRFIDMLLAYEDKRFYWHPGVDPLALLRASAQWLWHGEIISGASTLSMQTARLLEPIPRSLSGKLWQIGRALHLEWYFSKRDILKLYLQLAPYGGNLEGVRAASLAYFGKEPAHLTYAEAALLVVLPQSPETLRPDRYPERATQARNKVLERLWDNKLLTERTWREAKQQSILSQRREFPMRAAHLARRLHDQYPQQALLHTTLDGRLQAQLEALAVNTLAGLGPQVNMALIVVDNRDQAVLAHVGSADFFDTQRAGQIDLTQAIRSPGSTLKPVVYGMGFEDRLIHPLTLVNDAPTRFGSYQPSNFLNAYHGEVTIREALQKSLNIPAVAVLDRIGPARVAARLKQAGIALRWAKPQADPGLPLVLGGVGTTLSDLTALYTALAGDGKVRELRYLNASPPSRPSPLLSANAVWYLQDILHATPPPTNALPYAVQRLPRPVAYKTGTSYGFRDAWTLGFDSRYTVGVWIGRPDGAPNPGRHGGNTAAPVLFQVFALLPSAPASRDPAPAEILSVAHSDELPPGLRRLQTLPALAADDLKIAFPIDGATIELSNDYLPLVASGGRKPLQWLVNGRPLSADGWKRQAIWNIDGAGSARITVLDSAGRSASAAVWLSLPQ